MDEIWHRLEPVRCSEGGERCMRLCSMQCAARFHCLVEEWADCEELEPKPRDIWESVESKVEADKHRAERCATSNKNRCMSCGKNSRNMRMPGRCDHCK